MSGNDYGSIISTHYAAQAAQHGHAATSTMHDLTVRRREVEAIEACIEYYSRSVGDIAKTRLLELGCGNGYLLAHLQPRFPQLELCGMDYSPDMVELANARGIPNCNILEADIRELPYDSGSINVAVTERCIINLLDAGDQSRAFQEVGRVLKPGGLFICIEAFTDGLENLNRAKTELGLEVQNMPFHNRWLEKNEFQQAIANLFEIVSAEERERNHIPPDNFLSSHYFVSRVLYPAVTRAEIEYNTAFVEFFGFLKPYGNFSPIQLQLLRRLS